MSANNRRQATFKNFCELFPGIERETIERTLRQTGFDEYRTTIALTKLQTDRQKQAEATMQRVERELQYNIQRARSKHAQGMMPNVNETTSIQSKIQKLNEEKQRCLESIREVNTLETELKQERQRLMDEIEKNAAKQKEVEKKRDELNVKVEASNQQINELQVLLQPPYGQTNEGVKTMPVATPCPYPKYEQHVQNAQKAEQERVLQNQVNQPVAYRFQQPVQQQFAQPVQQVQPVQRPAQQVMQPPVQVQQQQAQIPTQQFKFQPAGKPMTPANPIQQALPTQPVQQIQLNQPAIPVQQFTQPVPSQTSVVRIKLGKPEIEDIDDVKNEAKPIEKEQNYSQQPTQQMQQMPPQQTQPQMIHPQPQQLQGYGYMPYQAYNPYGQYTQVNEMYTNPYQRPVGQYQYQYYPTQPQQPQQAPRNTQGNYMLRSQQAVKQYMPQI